MYVLDVVFSHKIETKRLQTKLPVVGIYLLCSVVIGSGLKHTNIALQLYKIQNQNAKLKESLK